MDMVKQALMGIVASLALGGCLTDPNIVYVPDTQQEEVDQDTGQGALLWPTDLLPAGWGVPVDQSHGSPLSDKGTLLAQSGGLDAWHTLRSGALNRTRLGTRVRDQRGA